MSIFRTIEPLGMRVAAAAPAAGGAGAELSSIDQLVSAIFEKNLDQIKEVLPRISVEALGTAVTVLESVDAKPVRPTQLLPIFIAAHTHFPEGIALLVEAGSPFVMDEGNLYRSKPRHIFEFASWLGAIPLMRALIKKDKKILEAFSDHRKVFLMWSVLQKYGFEVLDVILKDLGWDIDTVDGLGATLLNYAARSDQLDLVRGLIERRACVEFTGDKELLISPLMETVRAIRGLRIRDPENAEEKYTKRMDCFDSLLAAGANPKRIGFDLLKDFFECPMDDEDDAFIARMNDAGVQFDCRDEGGDTLLATIMSSLFQTESLNASEEGGWWIGGLNAKRIELLAEKGVPLPEDFDEFANKAIRELCSDTDMSDADRMEIADLLDKIIKKIDEIFLKVHLEKMAALHTANV